MPTRDSYWLNYIHFWTILGYLEFDFNFCFLSRTLKH